MKLIKVKCKDDREAFLKRLSDAIWKTIRVARSTSAIHKKQMFEKLPKKEAQELLNEAKYYQEFHPDRIEQFQRIINEK